MVRIFTLYGRMMAKYATMPARTKYIATFVIGLIIGLAVLGWWIWPVQWTKAAPVDLSPGYRAFYLRAIAAAYSDRAMTGDDLQKFVIGDKWSAAAMRVEVEALAAKEANPAVYASLIDGLKFLEANPPPTDGQAVGSSTLLLIAGLLAVVLVLIFASVAIVRRMSKPAAGRAAGGAAAPRAQLSELGAWPGEAELPLREFVMEYKLGDDHFDLSRAIETTTGMFLGECGMGISETIGTPNPGKVTALEVWLFDKNDIRTITSVLMSRHAFNDATLKSKLASKGDLMLAEKDALLTLETATLRLRARVTDLAYASGQLPPDSHFDRVRVVLAAWPLGDGGVTQPGDTLRN